MFPRYPLDADGFAHAYAPDDASAIRGALDTYGVVVVRALSREACERTVSAMFEEINALPTERKKKRTRAAVIIKPGATRASSGSAEPTTTGRPTASAIFRALA